MVLHSKKCPEDELWDILLEQAQAWAITNWNLEKCLWLKCFQDFQGPLVSGDVAASLQMKIIRAFPKVIA